MSDEYRVPMDDEEKRKVMRLALSMIFSEDPEQPAFRSESDEKWIDAFCDRLVKLHDDTAGHYREWVEQLAPEIGKRLIRIGNTKTQCRRIASLIIGAFEGAEFERHKQHTAWQWLRYFWRVPIDLNAGHYEGYYDKSWFYYDMQNTRPVKDCLEYRKLQEMYVDKFGGWDAIDLEHTSYDGHAWWTDKDLADDVLIV